MTNLLLYIGPGLGLGTIIIVLIILFIVFISFGSIIWISLKNLIRKMTRKAKK